MNNRRVYIVLTQTYTNIARIIKSITKDKYSHASLSLDPNVIKCILSEENIYTFHSMESS